MSREKGKVGIGQGTWVSYLKMSRFASFAALTCLFINFYIFGLFSTLLPGGVITYLSRVALYNALGAIAGIVLCSLFFPFFSELKNSRIIFVVIAVLPNIVLRFFGAELWINSAPARFFIHFFTGILFPLCYGLFFRTHLKRQPGSGKITTGKFYILMFAIAVSLGLFLRDFLKETLMLASDPLNASFIYNIVTWSITGVGVFSIICFILMNRAARLQEPAALPEISNTPGGQSTDWSLIFSLIGIAVVTSIMNVLINMRFFIVAMYTGASYIPYIAAAALPVFGYLAERSIQKFLRFFLLPAVIMFILLPAVIVLEAHPFFIICMNTIVNLFYNLIWVFFTVAVVKAYQVTSDFFSNLRFYFLVTVIHFILNNIQFIIAPVSRYIPNDTDYSIVIILVAAILFLVLSIRVLLPVFRPAKAPVSSPVSFEDIYRSHGLTKQEMIVADLIVKEGFKNEKIAENIYRSVETVKKHVSSILAKFAVKTKTELVAAVMREKGKSGSEQ